MATTPTSIDTPVLESPLPSEVLQHLYASMLKARMLSRRLRNAKQTVEAILSATLQNLEQPDLIVTDSPNPVLEILRGADISAFTSPKLTGNAPTLEPKIVFPGADAAAAVAAGLAMAQKRSQTPEIVVAFLSGKITKGLAWNQVLRFAGENRLPMLFVADWTDFRTSRGHDGKDLSHWPCPTIAVDGRDVIAVYRVTKEATSAARRGYGPTLIDCINFLAPGTRGRDTRDPITSFRGYLKRHNAWSDAWASALERDLKNELGLATKRR
jgi:hypothetical protein